MTKSDNNGKDPRKDFFEAAIKFAGAAKRKIDKTDHYRDITESYSEIKLERPNIDLNAIPQIIDLICPNGRPAMQLNGRPLHWHRGLVSLCDPSSEGSVGAAASAHVRAMQKLFMRWRELDDAKLAWPKYDNDANIAHPGERGAYLLYSLHIDNRELLSDHYITRILKPYVQAKYWCRQTFWDQLRSTHEEGFWIGFQPKRDGIMVPMVPGAGFGFGRHYEVNRATYLAGFEYGEDEVPIENYPHRDPYPDQDSWLFFGTDQLESFANVLDSSGTQVAPPHPVPTDQIEPQPNQREPRKLPRGFKETDKKFVQEGVELCRSNTADSAHNAAIKLVQKYGDAIKGQSFDAKVDRLGRQIREALRRDGE